MYTYHCKRCGHTVFCASKDQYKAARRAHATARRRWAVDLKRAGVDVLAACPLVPVVLERGSAPVLVRPDLAATAPRVCDRAAARVLERLAA